MSECFPSFVKGDSLETREGLQEAEFNKALQAGGFKRERDRRVDAPAKNSDPLGAGTYLFSNCEWKDPSDDKDRTILLQGYQHLVERFPAAGRVCTFARFLEVVARFHDGWKPNAGRARKKQKTVDSMCCDDDASESASKTPDCKSFKAGTPFSTGAHVTIEPNDKWAAHKHVSGDDRSDLAVNPLRIATLSDMWTFNDGGKNCRIEASPLLGANCTVSADSPARPADHLEIGLSGSGGGGMLAGGSSLVHAGPADTAAAAAAAPSTGWTQSQQMVLRLGAQAAAGGALGKRDRDSLPSHSLLLEQMAKLRMRNPTPTPAHSHSPSPHGAAGASVGAAANPNWSRDMQGLTGMRQQSLAHMGQQQRIEFGGFHGSNLSNPGGAAALGMSGGGLPAGAQAGAAGGSCSTRELLLQNLREREYLTKKLLDEQTHSTSAQQTHMQALKGQTLQGLQGLSMPQTLPGSHLPLPMSLNRGGGGQAGGGLVGLVNGQLALNLLRADAGTASHAAAAPWGRLTLGGGMGAAGPAQGGGMGAAGPAQGGGMGAAGPAQVLHGPLGAGSGGM
jgi:hypothetical protein